MLQIGDFFALTWLIFAGPVTHTHIYIYIYIYIYLYICINIATFKTFTLQIKEAAIQSRCKVASFLARRSLWNVFNLVGAYVFMPGNLCQLCIYLLWGNNKAEHSIMCCIKPIHYSIVL